MPCSHRTSCAAGEHSLGGEILNLSFSARAAAFMRGYNGVSCATCTQNEMGLVGCLVALEGGALVRRWAVNEEFRAFVVEWLLSFPWTRHVGSPFGRSGGAPPRLKMCAFSRPNSPARTLDQVIMITCTYMWVVSICA